MNMKTVIGEWGRFARGGMAVVAVGLALALAGCTDAFGPGFLNLIDPSGSLASVDNAPGHVAIVFANNVTVDDELLQYMMTDSSAGGGGVDFTPAELRDLHPRIRFRVRITFVGGDELQNVVEFVSGSSKLVEDGFDSGLEPDLVTNDLTNVIVPCNVDRVEIDGPIEVFIPALIQEWRLIVDNVATGGLVPRLSGFNENSLRFIPLQVDDVDEDFNIIRLRNIGTRDLPVPVDGPRCGSVVTFNISGTLSVPFNIPQASPSPAFFVEPPDEASAARIGGRYAVRVEIH